MTTGTPQEPEGTQLVTQLGDAVGGPEVPGPDPETETVDLRRKLWNVRRLGESMAEDRDETVRRCGEQVLAVLGDAAAPDEIAALKRSCRILANITARNHQVMEAARIEMSQNGPHAAMQWILNNLPDVWDDDETAWDGKESAEAWFDRTEDFYRAQIAAAPPVEAGPAAGAPEALSSAPDRSREQPAASWRELEEAVRERNTAEAKLAGITTRCQRRLDMAILQGPVSDLCRDILAIIGSEKKGGAPYDRDFDGPVL